MDAPVIAIMAAYGCPNPLAYGGYHDDYGCI